MRPFSLFSLFCILMALSGCASIAPPPSGQPAELLEAFHLVGRVSVRYGNDGFSGTLDWRHGALRDEVLILSPLGQGVAQLVRNESGVMLTTSDQQVFHARDAESLTEQELGWRFPLSSLPYWVQGRPAPGGGADTRLGSDGFLEKLTQDGWQVDYAGYKTFPSGMLPGRIFLERGDLRLKLAVDEWRP